MAKSGSNGTQKTFFYAHIAIGNHHDFVPGFAHHAAEFVYLVARAERLRTNEQSNRAPGKISDDFPDHKNSRVLLIGNTEENFELGVVLAAETRVVLVC